MNEHNSHQDSNQVVSASTLASASSAPTTPGKAEGSVNPDQQSETSPAPSQLEPVEGDDNPADN